MVLETIYATMLHSQFGLAWQSGVGMEHVEPEIHSTLIGRTPNSKPLSPKLQLFLRVHSKGPVVQSALYKS